MNNKMVITMCLSISTLNVNAPIKMHRVAKWTRKQDPNIYCLKKPHFRSKAPCRLKRFHTEGNEKKKKKLR